MGNILNDIVDEVNIKPNKSKLIIKWVISIAGSLIAIAFVLGQFKASFFNRMDKFEDALNKNTVVIESMNTEMNNKFGEVNARIDKGYTDGLTILREYQEFNKKQLVLVLDYGQTNKELLKEMLEINMIEKTKSVENQMMQSRNEPVVSGRQNFTETIKPIEPKNKDYLSIVQIVNSQSKDTVFSVTAATMEFINSIDKNNYRLGAVIENEQYPKLYNVTYRNK